MHLRIMLLLLVVLTFSLVPILAHGEAKAGILVDAKCAAGLTDEAAVEAHTVSCALENREDGFGIVADGKFFRFDDFGNRQAQLLLKATQRTPNLKVRVEGHFEGNLIKVSEIETVE